MRDYHATAVVTPSGRVFVGGGEGRFSTPGGHDYDIFEPPYLHGAARPSTPELRPSTLDIDAWGQSTYLFDVGQTGIELVAGVDGMASLEKVALLAPGSMTHHSDMSARYIELPTVAVNQQTLQFDLPAQTVVPAGYYMLWVLTNGGIPSEAVWIKVQ